MPRIFLSSLVAVALLACVSGGVTPGAATSVSESAPGESLADPCTFTGSTAAEAYAWAGYSSQECWGGFDIRPAVALHHALIRVGFPVPPAEFYADRLAALYAAYPDWAQNRPGAAWNLAVGIGAAAHAVNQSAPHVAARFLRDLADAIRATRGGVAIPPTTSPYRRFSATDADLWQETDAKLRAYAAALEAL